MKKQKKAKDIMNRNVVSVVPSSSVQEAARLMRRNNIGIVPVVSAGVVKGMLTDRDITLRCVAEAIDPREAKAEDIMTGNVVSITPDQNLRDILSTMAAEQIHRLPVIEDGVIQGIISFSDVAKNAEDAQTEQTVAKTVEEISETPRWQVYGDKELSEKYSDS